MPGTTASAPLLHEQAFNLSQIVKVRLTKAGRKAYVINQSQGSRYKDTEIEQQLENVQDAAGYNSFELWRFMQVFGKFMPTFPTMDPEFQFFEKNEIILVPDELDVRLAHDPRESRLLFGDDKEINY